MNKLDLFNQKQLKTRSTGSGQTLPAIKPGDTIRIYQKFKEGDKTKIQPFEGIVLAIKHGKGISATVTVRKIAEGIGVEKIVPLHSPAVTKIQVMKHAKVRRAKLYYIREKAAKEIRKKMKMLRAEAEKPTEPAEETAGTEEKEKSE